MPGIFRLKGQVKHYDWGGTDFLPKLLAEQNPTHRPFAEYWMGVHPQGPAQLFYVGGSKLLSEIDPDLSYLLKILDVRDMLSIQVHPNREMAQMDFERENRLGIPLDASNRNYKDANHKPELMVALSSFWLLHGFRQPESLLEIFDRHEWLNPLRKQWEQSSYVGLYKWVMEMPQSAVNELLQKPLADMVANYQAGVLPKSDPCFWAARAQLTFSKAGNIDRGIFSIFLFNLVHLKRGQGIFQGAGLPHAYLEGQNVEIMANSDNVLRGGLTPKHIDVPELLRHVRPDPIEPMIQDPLPDATGLRLFEAPVNDFKIQSIELAPNQTHQFCFPSNTMLLLPEGNLELRADREHLQLGTPHLAAFIEANTQVDLQAAEASLLFIASGNPGGLR